MRTHTKERAARPQATAWGEAIDQIDADGYAPYPHDDTTWGGSSGQSGLGTLAALMAMAAGRAGVAYSRRTYTVEKDGARYEYAWNSRMLRAEQRVGLRQIILGEREGQVLADHLGEIVSLQAERGIVPVAVIRGGS